MSGIENIAALLQKKCNLEKSPVSLCKAEGFTSLLSGVGHSILLGLVMEPLLDDIRGRLSYAMHHAPEA